MQAMCKREGMSSAVGEPQRCKGLEGDMTSEAEEKESSENQLSKRVMMNVSDAWATSGCFCPVWKRIHQKLHYTKQRVS